MRRQRNGASVLHPPGICESTLVRSSATRRKRSSSRRLKLQRRTFGRTEGKLGSEIRAVGAFEAGSLAEPKPCEGKTSYEEMASCLIFVAGRLRRQPLARRLLWQVS